MKYKIECIQISNLFRPKNEPFLSISIFINLWPTETTLSLSWYSIYCIL